MLDNDHASQQRRATYVALTGIFLSLLTAFSQRERQKKTIPEMRPFDFVLLALATFRLGRLIAYDKVFETERTFFTETVPHESGAGDTVVPAGVGVRQAIGELISCPICAGTWVSALLVFGLDIAPIPTRMLVKIMASIGLAELLNAGHEAMQWSGEAARKEAGTDCWGRR